MDSGMVRCSWRYFALEGPRPRCAAQSSDPEADGWLVEKFGALCPGHARPGRRGRGA